MSERIYDVIVVGGGNAALCAAISAREQAGAVGARIAGRSAAEFSRTRG